MTRRGRPPHPDILTPREWEVLALLREGLSDQAIAGRLGISLDGAKYHVREILSKLGVASRLEAATWQPEEPAPARRWLALPLALRVAGALVVVAAIAGLSLLAWGVARTGSETGGAALDLPTPQSSPRMNPDAALLRAAQFASGDVREVEGGPTTWSAAKAAAGDTSFGPLDPPNDAATWFFRFRGMFLPSQLGISSGPFDPHATPSRPTPACMEVTVWLPDLTSERGPQAGMAGGTIDDSVSDCEGSSPVSRQTAIVLAIRAAAVSGAGFSSRETPPDVEATLTTFGEAYRAVTINTGTSLPEASSAAATPVWLITLSGEYFHGEGSRPEGGGTPLPTTVVACENHSVIIAADTGATLARFTFPSDACN